MARLWCCIISIPSFSWNSKSVTYCFPTHPLPPLEKAHWCRRRSASPSAANHLSGWNLSGSGKTSSLIRWTDMAWQLTTVFSAKVKPSMTRPPCGTYRGRDIGMAGKHRSPSFNTASSIGSSSKGMSVFLRNSSLNRRWYLIDLGWESSHIKKHRTSPVVSMPAAMWSRHSAAMSIVSRTLSFSFNRLRTVKLAAPFCWAFSMTKLSANGIDRGLAKLARTFDPRLWRTGL